ncbi:MAG TPA: phosphatase PAP2 family protein [Candidatus Methylacidiphilales bacterium]|jgi:acid phosphatase (class A)|nr:phosphatase PAP2 family protein [Candidatus Methylacidiphilales bacterium]
MNKHLAALPVFALLVVFLGLPVLAETPSVSPMAPAAKTPPHFTYLTGQEQEWSDFPKAPALGSSIDEGDLLITLSAQATRNDAQKEEALVDQHWKIKLISDVIDPKFETKFPATYAVLKKAAIDAFIITSTLKNENKRLRPFVQHPTLVIPLFPVEDYTYPSGHSSGSQLQARILGALFPSRAEDLLRRARQVADSRVVAGVHYASDTEAGENLGDLIFEQLEANAKFKQDLAAAVQKDGIPQK